MTCIVGLVHNGAVYLGGDSAAVSDFDIRSGMWPKVFRVGPYLIGYCDSFRFGQLLQYAFEPSRPTGPLMAHMVGTFVPELRDCLRDGGFLKQDNGREVGGSCLVGYDGRLFAIDDDFQVGESRNEYEAIGSGAPYALGSLHTGEPWYTPRQRVRRALEAAAHHCNTVRAPFTVIHERSS